MSIFKTKGVLEEKLHVNRFNIAMYSGLFHLLITMVLTFRIAGTNDDIKLYHVIVPLWGLLAYGLVTNESMNRVVHTIITLPFQIILNIVTGIFILKYRGKYPNVSKEHVDRYLKLKKLMKKS